MIPLECKKDFPIFLAPKSSRNPENKHMAPLSLIFIPNRNRKMIFEVSTIHGEKVEICNGNFFEDMKQSDMSSKLERKKIELFLKILKEDLFTLQ